MNTLSYVRFDKVDPYAFLPLLNSQKTRKHLIDHEPFTVESATAWINSKIAVDATPGCRVRAILVGIDLAGWCGIQCDERNYELAIVLNDKFWGLGRQVFKDLMGWAKGLGHKEVLIHFLHTRPGYTFLKKMASKVFETELYGSRFTTYQLVVK